jgi:hypothetical protein
MNCEQCTELMSDAVDGTLSPQHRAQLDTHCRACTPCRDLLRDLMEIRAVAATLDRRMPSPHAWNAVSQKTSAPRRAFSGWGGLAAAAALVTFLASAAWFGLGLPSRQSAGSSADLARAAASELQLAEQHYENAIKSLEQLAVNKDTVLDPAVTEDLAHNLQSIDAAIVASRTALKSEPDSLVAQTSLLEALRMKVALLQETVSLMNAKS